MKETLIATIGLVVGILGAIAIIAGTILIYAQIEVDFTRVCLSGNRSVFYTEVNGSTVKECK